MTATADGFPRAPARALGDRQLRHNLRNATHTIRDKRAAAVAEVPQWEALREAAARIKDEVLGNLDIQLERLEKSVSAAGGHVHWARDGAEACAIVTRLSQAAGAEEVIKVKSMTTDEIGLNEALGRAGIRAWETDLAEMIVQLAGVGSSPHGGRHLGRIDGRQVWLGSRRAVRLL